MPRRRRSRNRAPRPIVVTREADVRMRKLDAHHFADRSAQREPIEALLDGEMPQFVGWTIRGRRIA